MNIKSVPLKDIKYLGLVREFQDKWIALNEQKTRVIAVADNIKKLESQIKDSKETIIVRRILPINRGYATLCRTLV